MTAAVALGGNSPWSGKGPVATLISALSRLSEEFGVLAVSRFYRTPAFPPGSGPDFINAAALIRAEATPADILGALHRIEADHGRVRDTRWGPRTLDIDLLFVGDQTLPDRHSNEEWVALSLAEQQLRIPESLILPHPRLQDRGFVLVPLSEIAPGWRHPVTGRTVAAMKAALPEAEKAAISPV